MNTDEHNRFTAESAENAENYSTQIHTVLPGFASYGRAFFSKRASVKGHCLIRDCLRPSLLSREKDADFRDADGSTSSPQVAKRRIPNLVRYSFYKFWICEVGDLRMKGFDNGWSCDTADRP
jgi:hypothetical protein